jgi:C4-type Zn-finger protein
MPRAVRMTVCSSCLDDFPHKEMYTVGKQGTAPTGEVGYYTMFCKKCTKNNTDSYVRIIEEPKTVKKRKTKNNEKTSKKN